MLDGVCSDEDSNLCPTNLRLADRYKNGGHWSA